MPHTLLFVDDEENILKVMQRLFRRAGHEILVARNGLEALEILKKKPVSVIVSDQRMPGMTGTEMLRQAKEIQPDAVRIILTGYADVKAAMEAINDGRVYRFLPKPWDDHVLFETVQEAVAGLDLKREHSALQDQVAAQNEELKCLNETLERRVLERTNELEMTLGEAEALNASLRTQNLDTVKAFAGLLDLRSREIGAHCRRVAALVQPVCVRLEVSGGQATQDIVIAALLHDIGKICLPDAILIKEVPHLGSVQRDEMKKHPVVGEGQVQVIEGLASVARIIRHHHENVDGTGYPDRLVEDEIPVGAQVLRVIDTYDHLSKGGARKGAQERLVLEAMDRQVSRSYSAVAYNALLDAIEARKDAYDATRELKVPLDDLKEGMVLTRDLVTEGGILLVPKGEPFKSTYLIKIRNFRTIYETQTYAYVRREE